MDPLTNDERIAALLDGRLSGQERDALLAELGISDDELEILVDSAGITAELEEEDHAAGVIPLSSRQPRDAETPRITRPPVWRRPALLSAAAVAVLAIGGGLLLSRGTSGAASPVGLLADPGAGVPAAWTYPWTPTRGDGTPRRAASVRFGAFAADLELSAHARDSTRTAAYADSVARLLEGLGSAASAAPGFRRLAEGRTVPTVEQVQRLAVRATEVLPEPRMAELGTWIETARVAAEHRDEKFFAERQTRSYLEGAARLLPSEAARAALGRVRAALPAGSAPDWPRLRPALDDLLKEAG
ncbi:MAG TPA: hypothetical protein VF541_22035 [Longimicrobium sp.]